MSQSTDGGVPAFPSYDSDPPGDPPGGWHMGPNGWESPGYYSPGVGSLPPSRRRRPTMLRAWIKILWLRFKRRLKKEWEWGGV